MQSLTIFTKKTPSMMFNWALNISLKRFSPFKRQTYTMVKQTQLILWLLLTNCLSVFEHFVGMALKRLRRNLKWTTSNELLLVYLLFQREALQHLFLWSKIFVKFTKPFIDYKITLKIEYHLHKVTFKTINNRDDNLNLKFPTCTEIFVKIYS